MSEIITAGNSSESRYRHVNRAMWLFSLVFVLGLVVPWMLSGWDRRAVFANPVWRLSFGSYLIASGFTVFAFCRTMAIAYAVRVRRSRLRRLLRRVFGDGNEVPRDLYSKILMDMIVFGVLLMSGGIAFCADWIPHPQ